MTEPWAVVVAALVGFAASPVLEWVRWALTRRAVRDDRRQDFQREHLLALQVALLDFSEAMARFTFMPFLDPEPTTAERVAAMDRAVDAEGRVGLHSALVDDEESRRLAGEAMTALKALLRPDEEEDAAPNYEAHTALREASRDAVSAANRHIGSVVRGLHPGSSFRLTLPSRQRTG